MGSLRAFPNSFLPFPHTTISGSQFSLEVSLRKAFQIVPSPRENLTYRVGHDRAKVARAGKPLSWALEGRKAPLLDQPRGDTHAATSVWWLTTSSCVSLSF